MGDKPKPFKPYYHPLRDDITGKMFSSNLVRECPEPNVIKRYGTGGKVNVTVWTCRKCKYVQTYPMHGGVSCKYQVELPTRDKSNG